MAINYDLVKTTIQNGISSGMEGNLDTQYASLNLPKQNLEATFIWDGTATVLTDDTSEVATDQFIQLDADGRWFKIAAVVVDSHIIVEDTYQVGEFPAGGTPSSIASVSPPPPLSGSGATDPLAEAIAQAVTDGIRLALTTAEISDAQAGSDTLGPGVIS